MKFQYCKKRGILQKNTLRESRNICGTNFRGPLIRNLVFAIRQFIQNFAELIFAYDAWKGHKTKIRFTKN